MSHTTAFSALSQPPRISTIHGVYYLSPCHWGDTSFREHPFPAQLAQRTPLLACGAGALGGRRASYCATAAAAPPTPPLRHNCVRSGRRRADLSQRSLALGPAGDGCGAAREAIVAQDGRRLWRSTGDFCGAGRVTFVAQHGRRLWRTNGTSGE